MAKEVFWTVEKLEQYIRECVKTGASLSSAKAPSAARKKAVDYFGSWKGLLKHCGVKRKKPKVIKEKHFVKSLNEVKNINTDAALEIPAPDEDYVSSLCWDCFRPLSSKGHYCPWHDHFEIPKGAVFFYKNLAYGGGRKDIAIIVECPLFLRETKELRKASREKMLEKLDYEYIYGNRGLSNYKVSL